jgi:hypothetical protein
MIPAALSPESNATTFAVGICPASAPLARAAAQIYQFSKQAARIRSNAVFCLARRCSKVMSR